MNGFGMVMRGGLALALVMAAVPSCRKPKEAVKADLGEAGYQFTATDWFRANRADDVGALKKFVGGGFALDTRDEAGDCALHAAAAAGANKAADFLLHHGLTVDSRGAMDRTPLMAAVVGNQGAMVRWLLRQGADPRAKDKDGFTAMMLAVREGKSGPVKELAPYQRESLDAALLLAALVGQSEVIDTLANYGASVYARMEDGRTPLMVAAENGHGEAVQLLLDIGASRLATDAAGHTAADWATSANHPAIVALLCRDPRPSELTLETPGEVAMAMDAFVEQAAAATTADSPPETPHEGMPAPPAVRKQAPSRSIQGAVLSAAVALAAPRPEPLAARQPVAAAESPAFPMPPLVMRHYRERELPVQVRTVTGNTATLSLSGPAQREVQVRAGETIAGSRLLVVRVQRRMQDSKLNLGQAMEVSVVEVRDTATGATREWRSGLPSSAHDPVALLEDAATGQRYTATPGQRFKSADGAEFIISDVRPNQLVIENAASGSVQTLPLRGPRG